MHKTLLASAALALSLTLAAPATAQTDAALRVAILQDDPGAIAGAIRAGADPRAVGENGSPLAIAAMSGKARAVRALLDLGADPAAPGPNGGNAVSAAFFAMNGVALLGRDEAPEPARRAAALDVLRAIAARGVGLDVLMRLGPTSMTPLMQAAEAGAVDVVQILLQAGANPNAVNGGRYSALDYAVDRAPSWAALPQDGRAEIVRALLAKGARRDRAGADGVTPLARARRTGNAEVIAALEGG
ncbi:ankyrin repeat domain-containing protein [Phenylobacterium sp. CCH9-H3]|uniref:ankyrin repeat domain-containing protein n=1 Tax=Phenylobacterium sp. CCH9-H3 TaxID=1768774 RepID=UPI00083B85AE|nr:ankyrin repeat domain-containing protein [Phenylobacterium sp. CCH9-H3]